MLVMPFLLQPFVFPDQMVDPPTKCHARATAVVSGVVQSEMNHLEIGFVLAARVPFGVVQTPLAVRQSGSSQAE